MNTSATGRQDPFFLESSSLWGRMGRAVDRFFFQPADPTTLGMIRICCGLIALYTAIAFGLDLQAIFGKNGWMDLRTRNEWRETFPFPKPSLSWEQPAPPQLADAEAARKADEFVEKWGINPAFAFQGEPIWSIWFHVTDPAAMLAVHYLIVVIVFLFMIGCCTRITSVLTWVGMLGYIHRSPTTVFGVDAMMSIALCYLMIGPSGAALSVDRLIRRWWVTYRALRQQRLSGGGPVQLPTLPVAPSASANLAYRLFQIHVCIIYGAAGLAKLQGTSWWTGEAVWGTLANFDFAPMQYDFYYDFLKFLCDNRLLWQIFMAAGTIFTLVFEIGFMFLVWNHRTRWVFVGMAVMLHGGIGLFMGLKTFSLMMLTLVMAFTPPEMWKRVLRGLSRGPIGLRLYFPAQARRSVRAASAVHALDIYDQVALLPVDEKVLPTGKPEGVVLALPDGRNYRGQGVWLALFRSLGIFRFFIPWNVFLYRSTAESPRRPWSEPEAPTEPLGLKPPKDAIKIAGGAIKQKH